MNWKRIAAVAAVMFGLLAVAGIGVGRLFLDQWHRFEPVPQDPTGAIEEMIRTTGYTPAVADAVHGLVLPRGIERVFVSEYSPESLVLAANPPDWEGKTYKEAMPFDPAQPLQGMASIIKAPDGKEWAIGVASVRPVLPEKVGVPTYLAGLAAAVLAWLSLAAWIYLDARDHGSTAAPGWALLGVLAAPLALAVWLINRRVQEAAQPPCPGCGAETVKDAAFCVRCGMALHPTCHDCRRPVETDWTYCATCGSSLTE